MAILFDPSTSWRSFLCPFVPLGKDPHVPSATRALFANNPAAVAHAFARFVPCLVAARASVPAPSVFRFECAHHCCHDWAFPSGGLSGVVRLQDDFSHVWVVFRFHVNVERSRAKRQREASTGQPRSFASKVSNSDLTTTQSLPLLSRNVCTISTRLRILRLSLFEFFFSLFFSFNVVGFQVVPPRAGGKRVGVFATRSPHRPNPVHSRDALDLHKIPMCFSLSMINLSTSLPVSLS